jgi:hypothetical protein
MNGLWPGLAGGLLAAAVIVVGQTPVEVEPPHTGPAAAEALELKLVDIVDRYRNGAAESKDYRMTEVEVNAYFAHRLREDLPRGVEGLWVRFTPEKVNAGGRLKLDELRAELPPGLALFLGGDVPVEVAAKLTAKKGVARVDVQEARLGGMELPSGLLQQILSHYSKSESAPGGIRLDEPFDLPYGIESARVGWGEVVLQQRPRATRRGGR